MQKSTLMLESLLSRNGNTIEVEKFKEYILPPDARLKEEEMDIKIEPDVTIEPIRVPDLLNTMPKPPQEPLIRVKSTSSLLITNNTNSTSNNSTIINTNNSTIDNNKIKLEMERRRGESSPPPPLVILNHLQKQNNNDLNRGGSPNDNYSNTQSTSLLSSSILPLIPNPSDDSSLEPTDLSNKKPENLTCVPEIENFIKEEMNDAASDYSNSSDPERLEVDMSQVHPNL